MILEQAWNYLNDAKYTKAIKLCKDYLKSKDKEFELEANKLIALAYFQMKEFKKSVPFYHSIAQKTNNSEDWFNLAMASSLCGESEKYPQAFQNAIDNYENSDTNLNISVPIIRLFYMKELLKIQNYPLAFQQLTELSKVYQEHEITDNIYLYMNNIPKFSESMESCALILNKNLTPSQALQWLHDFASSLDDNAKELINQQIKLLVE